MTHITTDINEYPIKRLVRNSGMEEIGMVASKAIHSPLAYIVFLNGNYFIIFILIIYIS